MYLNLHQYYARLATKPYQELGWDGSANDPMERLKLRTLVLKKMCHYGTASKEAGARLLQWKESGQPICPDLRDVVYTYGMKAVGDEDLWNWMLDRYVNESNAQEKAKLLRGLASVSEPWLISYLLDLAKDEKIIRSQDYFTLLTYISWNRVGEPLLWDYIRCQWPQLVERFSLNNRLMGRMVADITKKFATQQRLDEMKAFFTKYPDAGAGENYRKIALETVQNNIKFVQDNSDVIDQWLTQRK